MIKWLKARSRQEKWMIALIVVLIIGIILRWEFVKKETTDAVRYRIERATPPSSDNEQKEVQEEQANGTETAPRAED